MYEAAVARLIAAAEACGVYQTQLSAFTDRLAGTAGATRSPARWATRCRV